MQATMEKRLMMMMMKRFIFFVIVDEVDGREVLGYSQIYVHHYRQGWSSTFLVDVYEWYIELWYA